MSISENILMRFCRDPAEGDLNATVNHWNEDNAFEILDEYFPDFRSMIAGNSFVDFGCGKGAQSFALLRAGAKNVLGVDINQVALDTVRAKASQLQVQDKIQSVERITEDHQGQYDFVISQNSMEHFPDPKLVLDQMKSALKPGGKILMTFGPPWYAPYGSHMHFFTMLPWINILFSEKTVMKVRGLYRSDGAKRYEEVAFGLNKMSVRKFEKLTKEAGLSFHYRYYRGVKNLDVLTKLPVFRELFTNQISCVLQK